METVAGPAWRDRNRDAARELVGRAEALLDAIADDGEATAAVQAVVELYGEALRRLVAGADPVEDELLSHLLLVHDLHTGGEKATSDRSRATARCRRKQSARNRIHA